ncbi:MAG: hypothetical protein M3Q71_07875 [Chloroflexota bacterium]|nr:hypothetical protein [Chloroflexota bacterium]
MSGETTPKAKPETWLDWLPAGAPEPELLSRDEVLARLQERGVDVSSSDLRYWEYAGVLPRPIRRWHQGATRAVYPGFAVPLIADIRRRQRSRVPLDQIGPQIRERGRFMVALSVGGDPSTDEGLARLFAAMDHALDDARPTPALIDEVGRLVERRERLTGIPIKHVELRVTDARGKSVTYPIPPRPVDSE